MTEYQWESDLDHLLGDMSLRPAMQQRSLRALYRQARALCHDDVPGNVIQLPDGDAASALLLAWVINKHTRQMRGLFVPSAILRENAASFAAIGMGDSVQALDGLLEEKEHCRNWLGMVAMIHSPQPVSELEFTKMLNLLHRQFSEGCTLVIDNCGDGMDQLQHLQDSTRELFAADPFEHGVVLRWQRKFPPDPAIPAQVVAEFAQDDPVLHGISTLMSANERFQVYHVARNLLPIRHLPVRFVEIGSFAGGTFFEICMALQRQGLPFQGVAVEPYIMPQFAEVMRHFGDDAVHLQMKSHDAAPVLNRMFQCNAAPELMLIDGDHTYEAVCSDINDFYPLLAPGGIMMFHDYLPPCDERNNDFINARKGGSRPSIGEACRELLEGELGLEPLHLPLLYPGNPAQTLASQPIIPGLYSTVRAYRKRAA